MDGARAMLTNIGGHECTTCPWKAFRDPVCADVINAAKWFESGQVAMRLGTDPPNHLIEGIEIYEASVARARADRWDRKKNSKR